MAYALPVVKESVDELSADHHTTDYIGVEIEPSLTRTAQKAHMLMFIYTKVGVHLPQTQCELLKALRLHYPHKTFTRDLVWEALKINNYKLLEGYFDSRVASIDEFAASVYKNHTPLDFKREEEEENSDIVYDFHDNLQTHTIISDKIVTDLRRGCHVFYTHPIKIDKQKLMIERRHIAYLKWVRKRNKAYKKFVYCRPPSSELVTIEEGWELMFHDAMDSIEEAGDPEEAPYDSIEEAGDPEEAPYF